MTTTNDAPMTADPRPSNCRFRLADEGKAYPKSSCTACGKGIATGLGRHCTVVDPEPDPRGSGVREAMEGARFALFCSDMRIKDRADQALRLALASLASDASPRGEAVGYIDESDLRVLARIKGQTGACRITAIKAHAGPGYSPIYAHPAPATVEMREEAAQAALARIRKLRDAYADQAKFADVDEARLFRQFVERLDRAALASPAPASETEGLRS